MWLAWTILTLKWALGGQPSKCWWTSPYEGTFGTSAPTVDRFSAFVCAQAGQTQLLCDKKDKRIERNRQYCHSRTKIRLILLEEEYFGAIFCFCFTEMYMTWPFPKGGGQTQITPMTYSSNKVQPAFCFFYVYSKASHRTWYKVNSFKEMY